jgi:acyl carrier protein
MIPDERIAEVISRLTGVPRDELKGGIPSELPLFDSADSLDTIELIMELEEEFDKEAVRWAIRHIEQARARAYEARRAKRIMGLRQDSSDPLWDRELDG